MKHQNIPGLLILLIVVLACSSKREIDYNDPNKWIELDTKQKLEWRAVHLLGYNNNEDLDELASNIPKLK
ncbi:MAG: hypothetical protein R3250_14675, partial [Melioribacteraceae bacterium]|nr:hypothetical protein [Melioribacteraceae bacterium]